jgi:hypothetical protein
MDYHRGSAAKPCLEVLVVNVMSSPYLVKCKKTFEFTEKRKFILRVIGAQELECSLPFCLRIIGKGLADSEDVHITSFFPSVSIIPLSICKAVW